MLVYWNLIEDHVTYSAVNQEAFEPSDTLFYETFEILCVARDDATIEAHVNPALTLSSFDLDFQILNSSCRWYGV